MHTGGNGMQGQHTQAAVVAAGQHTADSHLYHIYEQHTIIKQQPHMLLLLLLLLLLPPLLPHLLLLLLLLSASIKGEEKVSISQILSHKATPNLMLFMNSGEYMW
jgi:hypothetical protein